MKAPLKRSVQLFLLMIGMALCAAALFYFCFYADNKYTAPGPRGEKGVLVLPEQDLRAYSPVFLIAGCSPLRIFSPVIISRTNMCLSASTEGLRGSTSGGVERSLHDSATYRLNIALPTDTRSYRLELPEIYSAYKLYINGELFAQMGEPDLGGYHAETGNSAVSFRAANRAEIIVAVADYSHNYSGMVYPPAFGTRQAKRAGRTARFAFLDEYEGYGLPI